MYKAIAKHPSTLEIYSKKLIAEGVVTEGEVDKMKADWRARLEAEFEAGQAYKPNKADWLDGRWAGLKAVKEEEEDPRRGQTGLPIDQLKLIGEGIDWATGEALAFGSLVLEGHPVRLSGQDSERGTFSQRHSVLIDQETEARYTPLNNIKDGQARYEVINSMLSEEAVLGFEYGYSLAEPNALVLWEG